MQNTQQPRQRDRLIIKHEKGQMLLTEMQRSASKFLKTVAHSLALHPEGCEPWESPIQRAMDAKSSRIFKIFLAYCGD